MRSRVLLTLAALASAALLWWMLTPRVPSEPTRRWFYDLNTGELFPAAMAAEAPIAAPSGDLRGAPAGTPAGVEAVVVRPAAGGPGRIAFLATIRRPSGTAPAGPTGGQWACRRLVRAVEGGAWVDEDSPQGQTVTARASALAGPGALTLDFPPD